MEVSVWAHSEYVIVFIIGMLNYHFDKRILVRNPYLIFILRIVLPVPGTYLNLRSWGTL